MQIFKRGVVGAINLRMPVAGLVYTKKLKKECPSFVSSMCSFFGHVFQLSKEKVALFISLNQLLQSYDAYMML